MPLRLRPDIATANTDDGLILLDERTGRYWQLSARFPWTPPPTGFMEPRRPDRTDAIHRMITDRSAAGRRVGKLMLNHAETWPDGTVTRCSSQRRGRRTRIYTRTTSHRDSGRSGPLHTERDTL